MKRTGWRQEAPKRVAKIELSDDQARMMDALHTSTGKLKRYLMDQALTIGLRALVQETARGLAISNPMQMSMIDELEGRKGNSAE